MFSVCSTRNNGIAYLIWRWLLRANGKFTSWLEGFYFGASRGMNDYDSLASRYRASNVKPDKQYSILPTVLDMVGSCEGKIVSDIGCGGGFFTVPFAERGASRVYGIDNSPAQIELARRISHHPAISYVQSDAFVDTVPYADVIVVPFVANYAATVPVLGHFFRQIHDRLNAGGRVILVIDLPNGKSLKKFGAVKTLLGKAVDGMGIRIDLFDGDQKICSLASVYYTPATIEALLKEAGFRSIDWRLPIVSDEGVRSFGQEFWGGYPADSELGYLTAEK